MSSEQPMSVFFWVSRSRNFLMHLPNFIRPYLALLIRITFPDWHCALKVSQLQNSLGSSEWTKPYSRISSEHPTPAGSFVSASRKFRMHLPYLIRPYWALSIRITWPCFWHSALNVSQLQYSRIKPELWEKCLTLKCPLSNRHPAVPWCLRPLSS